MIPLTVVERLYLTGVFNSYKGSLSGLVDILEDLKKIKISKEEQEEIGLKREGGVYEWKVEKIIKTSMNSHTKEFIKQYRREKDEKEEMTLEDVPLIHIIEKIEKE